MTYKTNVIDNKFRGDSISELNRLKNCYLSNIEAIINNKKLTDTEYFESMMIEYEKLSELKEMVIHIQQQ